MMSKNSFMYHSSASSITETVVALAAGKLGKWDPGGSAVLIGRQLALTAKHVIEEYWKAFELSKLTDGTYEGTFEISVNQTIENGTISIIWKVHKAFFSPISDLAILFLVPYSESASKYDWKKCAILDLHPPSIESRINCFGYSLAKVNEVSDTIIWARAPTSSSGIVRDVHEQRRDNGMLNFPCFQTNARFDAGMSGGGIFNEAGMLCGIISTNMPPYELSDEHCSYGTTLWPLMGVELDLDRENLPKGTKYYAIELAQKKFIATKGHEDVRVFSPREVGLLKR